MPGTTAEMHFALLMADINRMFCTSLYRQLKSEGIKLTNAQWRVITNLKAHNGLTQSELAERLFMEKAPLGTLINKLEASGLVERHPDPSDRRVKRVFITPAADPLQPLIENQVNELKALSMQGLSQQEQQSLLQLLGRIHSNLQTLRGKPYHPAQRSEQREVQP